MLRSIHRQETNFHNSIKAFTIRVTVTVTQKCMVIKIVYCSEYKSRARTPRSQGMEHTRTSIYTTKFISIKRFLCYTYRTNCTSRIKIKRTATQHYASRIIHDNANFHYRTPHRRSAYNTHRCTQNGRRSKMEAIALCKVQAICR